MINNPFILYGYESEEYFCDRKEETAELKRLVTKTMLPFWLHNA
jgi:hypothetical protein